MGCPKCGSYDVYRPYGEKWICNDCGYRWDKEPADTQEENSERQG